MQLKILVISSTITRGEFYTELFKKMGNFCISVSSGKAAEKTISHYMNNNININLVFIDYNLKDTDGISLGRKLFSLDPQLNMVLFPSRIFYKTEVQEAYNAFGRFMQKKPEASLSAFNHIFQLVHKRTELLNWIKRQQCNKAL